MKEYKLKRGFKPEMDRIKEVLQDSFQVPVTEEDGKLIVSYGALKRVEASIVDKKLCVDTTPNPNVTDEEILETNKKFRNFLDNATGYTAKQRVSKAKKDVQK
ncbi:MAG: hypothetical protein C5S33_07120 [ANME-2 cluster archaeon]|nr:hypothetical protein [ANME-2 cluster archaeon]